MLYFNAILCNNKELVLLATAVETNRMERTFMRRGRILPLLAGNTSFPSVSVFYILFWLEERSFPGLLFQMEEQLHKLGGSEWGWQRAEIAPPFSSAKCCSVGLTPMFIFILAHWPSWLFLYNPINNHLGREKLHKRGSTWVEIPQYRWYSSAHDMLAAEKHGIPKTASR